MNDGCGIEDCCENTPREIYKRGTVGKIHAGGLGNYYMLAVVLVDIGTACGGGDDIKAAINVMSPGDAFRNEWEIWWIGYGEFIPDEVA